MEYDFHALLHVDLSEAIRVKSYRWLMVRLVGVLSNPSSLLARYFNAGTEAPDVSD